MKRIICSLLAVLLLVSTSVVAFAKEAPAITGSAEPTFTVSSEQAHPGENISVTIRMEHNPGIASIKLRVQFGADLTLSSVTYNTALGGMFQQPQTLTSPVTLNWFNGAANTEGDMNYAVLNFAVAANASSGNHAVTISYDADDIYCIDAENHEVNVAFGIVNGGVNVTIPVKGLSLNKTYATASTGDGTYTLTPVFNPANATNRNVIWSSSNKTVATVSGGVVTLLKKGVTVITAVSEDGGFKASCTLTVLCSHLHREEIPADPSTCTHQGHGAYTKCTDCGEIVSGSDALLPLAAHQYGKPVWNWVGYESASAVFTCIECGDSQTLQAKITSRITKEPTATENGEREYTAKVTFKGKTYTDVKTEAIEWNVILGDSDTDGDVTIFDATAIQRYLAELPVTIFNEIAADADEDGDVTIFDATAIQRYLAQLQTNPNIGKLIG